MFHGRDDAGMAETWHGIRRGLRADASVCCAALRRQCPASRQQQPESSHRTHTALVLSAEPVSFRGAYEVATRREVAEEVPLLPKVKQSPSRRRMPHVYRKKGLPAHHRRRQPFTEGRSPLSPMEGPPAYAVGRTEWHAFVFQTGHNRPALQRSVSNVPG